MFVCMCVLILCKPLLLLLCITKAIMLEHGKFQLIAPFGLLFNFNYKIHNNIILIENLFVNCVKHIMLWRWLCISFSFCSFCSFFFSDYFQVLVAKLCDSIFHMSLVRVTYNVTKQSFVKILIMIHVQVHPCPMCLLIPIKLR